MQTVSDINEIQPLLQITYVLQENCHLFWLIYIYHWNCWLTLNHIIYHNWPEHLTGTISIYLPENKGLAILEKKLGSLSQRTRKSHRNHIIPEIKVWLFQKRIKETSLREPLLVFCILESSTEDVKTLNWEFPQLN
jgi:hypothetical protein